MAKEIKHNEKDAFQCEVCGMKYWERENAEQCQAHCEKNPGTCDPTVVEKAIKD